MYRIELRNGGDLAHTMETTVPLQDAIAAAEVGMLDHDANFAAILDERVCWAEVWSGRNDSVRD